MMACAVQGAAAESRWSGRPHVTVPILTHSFTYVHLCRPAPVRSYEQHCFFHLTLCCEYFLMSEIFCEDQGTLATLESLRGTQCCWGLELLA